MPRYAQDPQAPHPGTVTFVERWNHTEKTVSADTLPDDIKFFCVNADQFIVRRERAAWCIPVIEYDTVSLDEDGKPAEPGVAHRVQRSSYGPNQISLQSVIVPSSESATRRPSASESTPLKVTAPVDQLASLAQAPGAPHPGTVTFIDFNTPPQVRSSDTVTDEEKFFCYDVQGHKTPRDSAAWCVPIVEVEIIDTDPHGTQTGIRYQDSYWKTTQYAANHAFVQSEVRWPGCSLPPPSLPKTDEH